jgi:hypothetical protein
MAELHVVSALRDKRAEIAGLLADLERRLAAHRADLVHVDAVLRLYAPALEPSTIPSKAVRARSGWFAHGEASRKALDILREAGGPLETRTLAERLMVAKGLDPADGLTRELVQKTLLGTLARLRPAVQRLDAVTPGGCARWRIAP